MAKVSVIVVNHNGEQYIDRLFRSLKGQTFKDFEIIFIDNAPTDDALKLVQAYEKALPLKIVKNKRNVGFCLANNKAIPLCEGEYIVFLNNDTYVDRHWLEMLIRKAESSSETGAIVGSIRYPYTDELQGGPTQYDSYGAALGPAEGRFFYGMAASLLVEKNLLNKIGAFDAKLFMYQEDVDLCWRIRLNGYDIGYEPRSICYHLKQAKGTLKSNVQMAVWKFYQAHSRNRIRVLVKNYSRTNVLRKTPIALALIFIRSLLLSLVSGNPQYVFGFVKGLGWNLHSFRDTLRERSKVQRLRKKADSEVAKYMLPYSVELLFIGKLLRLIRTKLR